MKASGFAFRAELRGLLKLSLPIIFTQIIQVSNTTVAILMMGRVGSVELAALGLGGSFMIFVFLVCLGVMMSLSPTIAQHFGAGRNEGIRSAFQQGLWLAGATSLAAFFCFVRWDILCSGLVSTLRLSRWCRIIWILRPGRCHPSACISHCDFFVKLQATRGQCW